MFYVEGPGLQPHGNLFGIAVYVYVTKVADAPSQVRLSCLPRSSLWSFHACLAKSSQETLGIVDPEFWEHFNTRNAGWYQRQRGVMASLAMIVFLYRSVPLRNVML